MIDTSIQRVEINQVIENQLPEFVQTESPLFVDFMKQYYISQEYQGGSINIAENLDRYTKLKTYVGAALTEYTGLSTNTESYSSTIFVDSTKGYPSKYGLLKIDDEIITYTGIGTTSFTGCIRGFSGVDSMDQPTRPDLLSFNTSVGASHTGGSKVHNLSNLFIREFFSKLKTTYASGFENRKLSSNIDQVKFIRQVKDFYRTKGTEESYRILFRVLYGQEVNIADYQNLFNVIGYQFKDQSLVSAGKFAIPDFRGRMPLGKDNMGGGSANVVTDSSADTVGSVNGQQTQTLSTSNLPEHEHDLRGPSGDQYYTIRDISGTPNDSQGITYDAPTGTGAGQAYPTSGGVLTNSSLGNSFNIMNPYMTVNYIIYAGENTFLAS